MTIQLFWVICIYRVEGFGPLPWQNGEIPQFQWAHHCIDGIFGKIVEEKEYVRRKYCKKMNILNLKYDNITFLFFILIN